MSLYTRFFSNISKDDASVAGGKGASLGEMTQAGIPVPPGFVVLASTFDSFIKESGLSAEIDAILHGVRIDEMHTIEHASEAIQSLIMRSDMPESIEQEIVHNFTALKIPFVAVRSSATAEDSASAAWAGQLDSYLNTTEETLLLHVKKCWASLFTPRAIFYRFEKELHTTHISVAVVVQAMVNSEVSGIAFSVHPVTEDRNQMIIEAGFGLGEAIVSGQITPDSYVVEKDLRRIIDVSTNTQARALYRLDTGGNVWQDISEPKASSQVLSESQILELSDIVMRIEQHYGFPCDIEWAFESEKFYVVQSRPITTLQDIIVPAKTSIYDPHDYVRMFAGRSFVYILTDIFLKYYNELGVLSIQDKESWMSFFPKKYQEHTLEDGKELYTSKEKYTAYRQDFDEYIRSSGDFFQSILSKRIVSPDEVEDFFAFAAKHFSFYSKTEFFYTNSLDPAQMVISIEEFDTLKLDGRSYLNKIIFEEKGYVRSLLKKLSVQTGISESDLLNYSIGEVVRLVQEGQSVETERVAERETFFSSRDSTLFGEESRRLVDVFLSTYRDLSDTITGTIANRGKVRGRARVLIPDFRDFDKITAAVEEMEKGEVLVAETTAPEIIQACKKAAAIVTNQGGMLSHAAIVSRELGIPCIVGTDKDVILNIKTGDEVEVDADKGVIRIYKR